MASRLTRTATLLGTLALTALLSGCSGQGPAAAQSQAGTSSPAPAGIPEVLATVAGEPITLADLRSRIGDELDQNEVRFQRTQNKLIETALQEELRDRVLMAEARKQNKTVEQLILAEAGGSLEPSDLDIATWYEENKARTGGRSLETIRAQVSNILRTERRKAAAEALDRRLNQERQVVVHFEPYRVRFDLAGAPGIGPENAAITLVEFSDFECPFCSRFFPTLKRLEENYGKEIRIVYKQYPIASLHPNATKAAEASLCAHEQDKFWPMHDLLFEEQRKMTVADLKEKAGRIGLDQGRFNSCLDSGKYSEQVQKDLKEGVRAGVTGTPALFVNGVPIEGGAVPYETVVLAIEKEKARLQK